MAKREQGVVRIWDIEAGKWTARQSVDAADAVTSGRFAYTEQPPEPEPQPKASPKPAPKAKAGGLDLQGT